MMAMLAMPQIVATVTASGSIVNTARLEVPGAFVAASNRAAMLYGDDPRRQALALLPGPDEEPAPAQLVRVQPEPLTHEPTP